jgi:hypothetical protein
VWQDEHSLVSHRPVGEDGTTVLGYLYVESRRHVAYLADLSDAEAEATGRVVTRAAHGLAAPWVRLAYGGELVGVPT